MDQEAFKQLKRDLKHVFYDVEVSLKSGDFDAARGNFARFIELNDRFKGESEPEWEDNIKGMDRIITDLRASIADEDLDRSNSLVEKFWRYKKTCHRLFKD